MARIQLVKEVCINKKDGGKLCFQLVNYIYENGEIKSGYRFIPRDNNNKLRAVRGQTRLPSINVINKLINMAINDGWGDKNFEY